MNHTPCPRFFSGRMLSALRSGGRNVLLLAGGLCLLFACEQKEEVLADRLLIGYSELNPAVREIAANNANLRARQVSPDAILGYGNGSYFLTNNYFETLTIDSAGLPGEIVFWAPPRLVVWDTAAPGIRLLRSDISGFIFTDWLNLPATPPDSAGANFEVVGVTCTSHDTAFILVNYTNPNLGFPNTRSRLYRWTGDSLAMLFEEKLTRTPAAVHFRNAAEGWVVISDDTGNEVYATSDGGLTWSGPNAANALAIANDRLESGPGGRLYLFSRRYTGVFESADNGQSWSQSPTFPNLLDVHFTPAGVGFAAVQSNTANVDGPLSLVYRTDNAGQSWDAVYTQGLNVQRLHFLDDTYGIATYNNILHGTRDGGQSWQLLIHPQDY